MGLGRILSFEINHRAKHSPGKLSQFNPKGVNFFNDCGAASVGEGRGERGGDRRYNNS